MLSSSADAQSPQARGLDFRPFRALTYRRRDPEHLARVSSPAYDLVTPSGRERLADADPHNIVRLILPRVEPGAGEDGDVARRSAELSARTLRQWLDDGVLQRDDRRAFWLYELRPPGGAPATIGWLGAVALPPPGSRAVLAHEDTFPAAVEGRRALLAATATDLEPIILAHDREPIVAALTRMAQRGEPTLELEDADAVLHRLWRVPDAEVIHELAAAFTDAGAVIADGHHRFAAAQAYSRNEPGRPGADAILALLTPMGPGGLRVEPIHRVVPELPLAEAVRRAAAGFRVEELPVEPSPEAAARRRLSEPGASGFLLSDGHRLVRLRDPAADVVATVPREAPDAWRRLDVVLAHHGLFEHLWGRRDDQGAVLVAHDVTEALRSARERAGTAVLLLAPSPADVAAVARAGARMPRKSTLFVPKPRTGLVLRPHAD
ncbi:DUF1015 domain-containing protein [Geodermatophilus sp. URMC 64]